jgi:hypothetical protein
MQGSAGWDWCWPWGTGSEKMVWFSWIYRILILQLKICFYFECDQYHYVNYHCPLKMSDQIHGWLFNIVGYQFLTQDWTICCHSTPNIQKDRGIFQISSRKDIGKSIKKCLLKSRISNQQLEIEATGNWKCNRKIFQKFSMSASRLKILNWNEIRI